jgi:DNA helicase HerA-like ATPase
MWSYLEKLSRRECHSCKTSSLARVTQRWPRLGIKDENRFLHVYIIGKTGTGKSTLIETMALQDLERAGVVVRILPPQPAS